MAGRHIMVAVGAPLTLRPRALAKLAQLARAFEADIELVHCLFDWQPARASEVGTVSSDEQIRAMIRVRYQQLDSLAQRLRDRGIRSRVTVRWDYPAHEGIVREVLRQQPALLVAQSMRHAKLSRLMLTHTDYKLIESCPCPLLLMKNERAYTNPRIVAAIDPMHSNAKPAALDQAILKSASALSQALQGAVHVFHACAPWPTVMERSAELRRLPPPLRAEIRAAYEEKAQARVAELARRGKVAHDCIHIPWGEAAVQLPLFCGKTAVDIVVMGAVSRSRLRRVFIGHTAERVLDALSCDVLIVKPPDFKSPVDRRSVRRLPTAPQASASH
jgi:universal stress protein E